MRLIWLTVPFLLACTADSHPSQNWRLSFQNQSTYENGSLSLRVDLENEEDRPFCLTNSSVYPSVGSDRFGLNAFRKTGSGPSIPRTNSERFAVRLEKGQTVRIYSELQPKKLSEVNVVIEGGVSDEFRREILEQIVADAKKGEYEIWVDLLFTECPDAHPVTNSAGLGLQSLSLNERAVWMKVAVGQISLVR